MRRAGTILGGVAVALTVLVTASLTVQLWTGGDSAAPPTATAPPPLDPVFDEIDRALAAMPLATAAFNAPEELRLGDSVEIHLLLSVSKPISDLKAELTEIGEREGAQVRVAPVMEARLTGDGFRITAQRPERQVVGRTIDPEWIWDVEGTEGGSQQLHLTLTALITVEGERTPRPVRTFDEEIEIRVTLRQKVTGFIGDNWQWLWAVIVAPLLGLAAGLVRARRHRRQEKVETSYVQGPSSKTWHWCRNCSNYPITIDKTRPTRPSSGLCNQCTAKEADKNCRS
jgi:hypothetical protein